MRNRSIFVAVASVAAMIAIPGLAFADPGEMMHMTISGKIQISNPPMSMAIPTISKDVCSPKVVDVREL